MFEKLANGWRLATAVRKLVFNDKSLMVYPVISTLAILAEIVAIIGLFFVLFTHISSSTLSYSLVGFILVLILAYFLALFIPSYVIIAMYTAFKSDLNGNKISIGMAFSKAREYIIPLLKWVLFYSTVVVILQAIESRIRGIAGFIIGAATGVALSVALIFVMPVIYEQKLGPVAALKKSAETFVQHFGSTIGGLTYTDLYGLMFVVIGFIIVAPAAIIYAYSPGFASGILAVALGAVEVLGLALIAFGAIVTYTTSNIFKLVLFDYALGRGLPPGFDENLIKNALIAKQRVL